MYTLQKIISSDIIVLDGIYGSKTWKRCRLRKDTECIETKIELSKGDEAYRPMSNGYDRMERISLVGMQSICSSANEL